MSIVSIYNDRKRGLVRGFIFAAFALSLSGCALGPVGGAAISLASGTLTAASDITSSVVGTAVDVAVPDNAKETTE
jgi:hypothetical protein